MEVKFTILKSLGYRENDLIILALISRIIREELPLMLNLVVKNIDKTIKLFYPVIKVEKCMVC